MFKAIQKIPMRQIFILISAFWFLLLMGCESEGIATPAIVTMTSDPLKNPTSSHPVNTPAFLPTNTPTISPTKTPLGLKQSNITSTLTPTLTPTPSPTIEVLEKGKISGKLLVAYSSDPPAPRGILLVSLDDGHYEIASKDDIPGAWYEDPSWSPDGNRIVYSWGAIGSQGETINLVDMQAGTDVSIVQGDSPFFSPDGNEVIYIRDSKLFTFNTRTRGNALLCTVTDASSPSLSPDGNTIAYFSSQTNDLVLLELSTCVVKRMHQDVPVRWSRVSWASNGKEIAFRSDQDCGDICIFDLENGKTRCLKINSMAKRDPSWTPDGKWIIFSGLKDLKEKELCSSNMEPLALDWELYALHVDDNQLFRINVGDLNGIFTGSEIFPASPLEKGKWYSTTKLGEGVRLREAPSTTGSVIGNLKSGDSILVLDGPREDKGQNWWLVQTKDNKTGWILEQTGWYRLAID